MTRGAICSLIAVAAASCILPEVYSLSPASSDGPQPAAAGIVPPTQSEPTTQQGSPDAAKSPQENSSAPEMTAREQAGTGGQSSTMGQATGAAISGAGSAGNGGASDPIASSGGCVVDAFSCDGASLRQCASDAATFEIVADCTSAKLCNASAGRCDLAMCAPGTGFCVSNTLRKCNEDGTGSTDQACGSKTCNQTFATCDLCERYSWKCESVGKRMQCSEDGQEFVARPCSASLPYCYDGRCFEFNECITSRGCPSTTKECWTAACENHRCVTRRDPSQDGRSCTTGSSTSAVCSNGSCG